MAVKTVGYGYGGQTPVGTVDTARGPSAALWGDCPVAVLKEDPSKGTYFYDDFTDGCFNAAGNNGEKALGRWSAFVANSASAVLGTPADTTNLPLEGGILGLSCGSNNNLSITLAACPSTFKMISPATGFPLYPKLWFETSLAVSTVVSGTFDLFVGLMDTGDAGTRITSAADLCFSAADTIKTTTGMGGCIGFWKRATTNPTDVGLVHNVNNGTAQTLGGTGNIKKLSLNYAGGTMAALSVTNGIPTTIGDATGACFLKLGFLYDPNAAPISVATALGSQTAGALVRPLIQFFVNGKRIAPFYDASIVQASTFPSKFMAPVIGFRSGGSGAGAAYVDWIGAAQLASY